MKPQPALAGTKWRQPQAVAEITSATQSVTVLTACAGTHMRVHTRRTHVDRGLKERLGLFLGRTAIEGLLIFALRTSRIIFLTTRIVTMIIQLSE